MMNKNMIKPQYSVNGRLRSMEHLPTGGSQPSLSIAYLILSGTSGWALKQTSSSSSYALGTFSFLLGHSLLGFLHTTHPNPGEFVKKLFRKTCILAEAAPLALLNAEFYLLSGHVSEFAYAHAATAFLPIIANLIMEEQTQNAIDFAILGNLASLIFVQVVKETGVWTGGLIALTSLNHFLFKRLSPRYGVPKIEVITIGLSFFTVFALNCLWDLKA